jgi:hypothetical protein
MPSTPGARRGLTLAEKRSARFHQAQASLTPDQLVEQDQQNRAPATAPIVVTTLQELQMARRWFTEFMHDIYPEVDVDTVYFT